MMRDQKAPTRDHDGRLLLTKSELARELGCHRNTVGRAIAAAGVRPRGRVHGALAYRIQDVYPHLYRVLRK